MGESFGMTEPSCSPSCPLTQKIGIPGSAAQLLPKWVRTGDEVGVDAEGNLYVLDRIKELIKVCGFQVAPRRSVADACVVGLLDDYSEEAPRPFKLEAAACVRVENREGKRLMAEIVKFVADDKVVYKRLAGGVEFVDEIPKTPSGKLLRRHLRDAARAQLKAEEARGVLKARL
ncbi:hypothetical protein OF83DRAFT_1084304 [Amylostereum chailletii]|nr:hypothetical protein OF83DRAFT_1084304 [Amylostereum chailletii]